MKETTLNDIMHFTLGKNPTRLKESDVNLYTPKDFDQDLLDRDSKDSREVCIINLIRSKAAPMSDANREKILTSNFLRCELDASLIDGWYFCYQFNDGNALSQQIAMVNQGTTLSVKKLNLKTIGDLKIKLPAMEKQRWIGNIYRQFLLQADLLQKQVESMKQLTITVLRKIDEDN